MFLKKKIQKPQMSRMVFPTPMNPLSFRMHLEDAQMPSTSTNPTDVSTSINDPLLYFESNLNSNNKWNYFSENSDYSEPGGFLFQENISD